MKTILLIAYLLTLSASAGDLKRWDHTELADRNYDLNTIDLRNRASCAKESLNPTKSAFLIVDNSLLAKAVYRLAKASNQDSNALTTRAIKYYRKKVVIGMEKITSALNNRSLPLLSVLAEDGYTPSRYERIMYSCHEKKNCDELNTYIAELWNNSQKYNHTPSIIVENYKVDNFHSEKSYFAHNDMKYARTSCLKLKTFSPFQAHLLGTKPDREVLQKTAERLKNYDNYFTDCNDEEVSNLVTSVYQYDLRNFNAKEWNNIGFDYWNSVKVYLFWYLRNIILDDKLMEKVIGATDISDSILMVANGCGSLETPKCSNEYLSKNVIREMGKSDYKKNAADLDVFSPVVTGVQDDVLKDPFTAVNNDVMDFKDHKDADKWAQNLFKNFNSTKSYIRSKLIAGVSFYNILSKYKTAADVNYELQAYYNNQDMADTEVKNDIYYLCTETYFATHEEYSFIKKNIEIIKNTKFLDNYKMFFNALTLDELVAYYEEITKGTRSFCNSLDQKEIFDDSFTLDKQGFSQWYLDKINEDKQVDSTSKAKLESLNPESYLELVNGDAVCISPSHCIRQSIHHTIQLSRAVHYSNTFWNQDGKIRSGELLNPYAERVACKIYDPWFKSKAVMTRFFSDIAQAAVSAFTPGALYTKFDLQPGHVTSFNKLVKDGRILIDPNFEKQKVMMDLTADFGPLLGAPCAVSLSGKKHNGYNLYHFSGVSVGMCTGNEDNQLVVMSANDMNASASSGQACASCKLNFESVTNALTFFDYTIGPFYYLVRSVYRLVKGFKDPHNIARDWKINFKHLRNTYMKFGYIPKKCVKKLTKGRACLANPKEELAVSYWQNRYDAKILGTKKSGTRLKLLVEGCNSLVNVRFNSIGNKVRKVIVPKGCQVQ